VPSRQLDSRKGVMAEMQRTDVTELGRALLACAGQCFADAVGVQVGPVVKGARLLPP
jgi:hypothetical protein